MTEQRKNIIITAGCSGIGAELSTYLLRCGYGVLPTTRSLEHGQALINALEPSLRKYCTPMELKLDRQEAIEVFVQEAAESYDKIHGLINCAVCRNSLTDPYEMKMDTWEEHYRINVFAVACLSSKIAEQLIRQDGAIINFSSFYSVHVPDNRIYDENTIPTSLIYASSKAALNYITQYMAVRYAGQNISVNAILAGGVGNPSRQGGDFVENYCYRTPMKRMAHIDEFNKAVEFFLSENSRYCTGQLLSIDGGWGLL